MAVRVVVQSNSMALFLHVDASLSELAGDGTL
jgi:hypothetical protein